MITEAWEWSRATVGQEKNELSHLYFPLQRSLGPQILWNPLVTLGKNRAGRNTFILVSDNTGCFLLLQEHLNFGKSQWVYEKSCPEHEWALNTGR